jgi:hypothetical protein
LTKLEGLLNKDPQRINYLIAWVVTLLPSSLTLILWRELGSGEPSWWPMVPFPGLLLLSVGGLILRPLKPIWGYIGLMLILFLMGF